MGGGGFFQNQPTSIPHISHHINFTSKVHPPVATAGPACLPTPECVRNVAAEGPSGKPRGGGILNFVEVFRRFLRMLFRGFVWADSEVSDGALAISPRSFCLRANSPPSLHARRYISLFASSFALIRSGRSRSNLRRLRAASLSSSRCAFLIPSYATAASFAREIGGLSDGVGGFPVSCCSFFSSSTIWWYSSTSKYGGLKRAPKIRTFSLRVANPLPPSSGRATKTMEQGPYRPPQTEVRRLPVAIRQSMILRTNRIWLLDGPRM